MEWSEDEAARGGGGAGARGGVGESAAAAAAGLGASPTDIKYLLKQLDTNSGDSHCFTLLWLGHGVPVASILYYSLGAVVFGVSRGKGTFETIAFTLEFTTAGGLEHVNT
ncbi:hypothetical protein JYU34_010478 [Plutella xylostella]|uniref:Uncharacterized protein n=1 Tax=Plutella xylostella TaxID=51655 RepID=A0ABQ7QIL6_PLUXY|nr:hypothetical protein JYU34_010478 [Plutella xylostella]